MRGMFAGHWNCPLLRYEAEPLAKNGETCLSPQVTWAVQCFSLDYAWNQIECLQTWWYNPSIRIFFDSNQRFERILFSLPSHFFWGGENGEFCVCCVSGLGAGERLCHRGTTIGGPFRWRESNPSEFWWDFAKKGGFRVEKMWWILEIFHEIFGCNLFPPKMGC